MDLISERLMKHTHNTLSNSLATNYFRSRKVKESRNLLIEIKEVNVSR